MSTRQCDAEQPTEKLKTPNAQTDWTTIKKRKPSLRQAPLKRPLIEPRTAVRRVGQIGRLQTTRRKRVWQSDDHYSTLRRADQHQLTSRRTILRLDRPNDRITNRNAAHSLVAITVEDLDD